MCLPAPNVKNATPPCRRTTAEKLERAGCQASAAIYGRGHRVSSTRATPARLFARRNPATCSRRLRSGRTPKMRALLDVILLVLQIYIWLLIAAAILSWLIAFGVVNTRNQAVAMLGKRRLGKACRALRPLHPLKKNLSGI